MSSRRENETAVTRGEFITKWSAVVNILLSRRGKKIHYNKGGKTKTRIIRRYSQNEYYCTKRSGNTVAVATRKPRFLPEPGGF